MKKNTKGAWVLVDTDGIDCGASVHSTFEHLLAAAIEDYDLTDEQAEEFEENCELDVGCGRIKAIYTLIQH